MPNRSVEIKNISTLTYFPSVETKTGTVSSSGTVVTGTGTFFTTELLLTNSDKSKYFLVSAGEIRDIVMVNSDSQLIISAAFTTPLSASALTVCSKLKGNYSSIKVTDTTGAIPIGLLNAVVVNVNSFNVDAVQKGVACFSVQKGTGTTSVTAVH